MSFTFTRTKTGRAARASRPKPRRDAPSTRSGYHGVRENNSHERDNRRDDRASERGGETDSADRLDHFFFQYSRDIKVIGGLKGLRHKKTIDQREGRTVRVGYGTIGWSQTLHFPAGSLGSRRASCALASQPLGSHPTRTGAYYCR